MPGAKPTYVVVSDEEDAEESEPSMVDLQNSEEEHAETDGVPDVLRETEISKSSTRGRSDDEVIRLYDEEVNYNGPAISEVIARLANYFLKRKDIVSTKTGEFINDEIINAFLYLVLKPHANTIYIPDTFFYRTLTTNENPFERLKKTCLRYIRTKMRQYSTFADIHQMHIPINHGDSHWTLLVVDFQQHRMVHYDSINNPNAYKVNYTAVKDFVQGMYDDMGVREIVSTWPVVLIHDEQQADVRREQGVPGKQTGGVGCGAFVCATAFCLLHNIRLNRVHVDMMNSSDTRPVNERALNDEDGTVYMPLNWRREIGLSLMGARISPNLKTWLTDEDLRKHEAEEKIAASHDLQQEMSQKTFTAAAKEAAARARNKSAEVPPEPVVEPLDGDQDPPFPPAQPAIKIKFFKDETAGATHIGGDHKLLFTFATRGSRWTARLRQCNCTECGATSNLHPMCGVCTEKLWGVRLVDTEDKGVGVIATRSIPVGTQFQYYGEVLSKPQEIGRYLHKTAPYVYTSDGGSARIDGALVRSVANMMNSRQPPAEKNPTAKSENKKSAKATSTKAASKAAAKAAEEAKAKEAEEEAKAKAAIEAEAVCMLDWHKQSGLPMAVVMRELNAGEALELHYGDVYLYNDAFHITRVDNGPHSHS